MRLFTHGADTSYVEMPLETPAGVTETPPLRGPAMSRLRNRGTAEGGEEGFQVLYALRTPLTSDVVDLSGEG